MFYKRMCSLTANLLSIGNHGLGYIPKICAETLAFKPLKTYGFDLTGDALGDVRR